MLANLLTGVTIGLTVAAVLGLSGYLGRWLHRREQIKFVREFIAERFRVIRDFQGADIPTPIDGVRWTLYQAMLRDLEGVLSYRTTMLDYGKIHNLQSILTGQNVARDFLGTTVRVPEGIGYYRQKYNDFQEIAWLKLPPDY